MIADSRDVMMIMKNECVRFSEESTQERETIKTRCFDRITVVYDIAENIYVRADLSHLVDING